MDLPDQEDDLNRSGNATEQVAGGGGRRDRTQRASPKTKRGPLPCPGRAWVPSLGRQRFCFGRPYGADGHSGNQEAPASTATAAAPPMAWTRPPATLGPATAATCGAGELGVPLHQVSRPTKDGRYDW